MERVCNQEKLTLGNSLVSGVDAVDVIAVDSRVEAV